MYCATPELLNTDAYCLICLAAKLVGWVGPCAGMISWVCKLVDRVRLGEKSVPCPSLVGICFVLPVLWMTCLHRTGHTSETPHGLNKVAYTQTDRPGAAPDQGRSLISTIASFSLVIYTQDELTSQNLWSRYVCHFVGIQLGMMCGVNWRRFMMLIK